MRRVGFLAVIATALLALMVITPWGDFQGHPHWDEVGWIPFVSWPVRARDIMANCLLCVPLGIACAYHFRWRVLSAGLMAFMVSFTGEWLQVYSHSRFPSATDLVCNTMGAVVAALVIRWHLQRAAFPAADVDLS